MILLPPSSEKWSEDAQLAFWNHVIKSKGNKEKKTEPPTWNQELQRSRSRPGLGKERCRKGIWGIWEKDTRAVQEGGGKRARGMWDLKKMLLYLHILHVLEKGEQIAKKFLLAVLIFLWSRHCWDRTMWIFRFLNWFWRQVTKTWIWLVVSESNLAPHPDVFSMSLHFHSLSLHLHLASFQILQNPPFFYLLINPSCFLFHNIILLESARKCPAFLLSTSTDLKISWQHYFSKSPEPSLCLS